VSARFSRILHEGNARWVRHEPDQYVLLSKAPWDAPEDAGHVPEGFTLLAPAEASKIVCVGRNYAAHAAELGNQVPKEPLLFLKPPSALIAHGEAIELPSASECVEHEGELAAVIGCRLRDGDVTDAANAVFGWTCANDVTARDIQRADVQFTRGKGFDTFCPLGPSLTTDVDVSSLGLEVFVGEEPRQRGRTDAMVWPPYELIAFISNVMTLEPGDIVLTGTPAGVGPMKAGDIVRVSIEGLEDLVNPVRDR
jgi:2-keto-4-pentenoate hydratase/2-oxohepta-3-ene-1,7-dioic acid hydratase in catechol pathway